jgi:hypothetical protein
MHPSEIALTLSADVLRLPYTPATRLVLAEIVSLYAANAGCCDASDAHFAARLTINKDTANVAVKLLEKEGLVTKVVTRLPTGFYRTLTPNPAAIAAKAASNPYPENTASPTRNFRVAQPEIPATPSRKNPLPLAGNSVSNTPSNIPVSFHTLNNDAADAAALGSEKKIGLVESPEDYAHIDAIVQSWPSALPAEVEVSAPRCAAPPAKLQLMRLSAVATFPAFAEAWDAATAANPDTYADYASADLLHYHTALLDWSNANGKKKIDWLATIRSSMRNDHAKGQLRKLCPTGVAASSPVLKRLATAEAAFALNEYDEAGNRIN